MIYGRRVGDTKTSIEPAACYGPDKRHCPPSPMREMPNIGHGSILDWLAQENEVGITKTG